MYIHCRFTTQCNYSNTYIHMNRLYMYIRTRHGVASCHDSTWYAPSLPLLWVAMDSAPQTAMCTCNPTPTHVPLSPIINTSLTPQCYADDGNSNLSLPSSN